MVLQANGQMGYQFMAYYCCCFRSIPVINGFNKNCNTKDEEKDGGASAPLCIDLHPV
jgi:hypothetical protein